MKLVVAITGASGVSLGIKLLRLIPDDIDIFCIISNSAKVTLSYEEKSEFYDEFSHITFFDDDNLAASISSGSFGADKFIVVPCSMNSLAKFCVGISDTLITRVFSVMLKEQKRIILAPRELPLNTIQLDNMAKMSSLGVVIAPPILGYYSDIKSLDEMENFIIGKWFDLLDIKHTLYKRWE